MVMIPFMRCASRVCGFNVYVELDASYTPSIPDLLSPNVSHVCIYLMHGHLRKY